MTFIFYYRQKRYDLAVRTNKLFERSAVRLRSIRYDYTSTGYQVACVRFLRKLSARERTHLTQSYLIETASITDKEKPRLISLTVHGWITLARSEPANGVYAVKKLDLHYVLGRGTCPQAQMATVLHH